MESELVSDEDRFALCHTIYFPDATIRTCRHCSFAFCSVLAKQIA
jgi:hypothetical protein